MYSGSATALDVASKATKTVVSWAHRRGQGNGGKGAMQMSNKRGSQIPGRQFTMGLLNHCSGAELLLEAPKVTKMLQVLSSIQ